MFVYPAQPKIYALAIGLTCALTTIAAWAATERLDFDEFDKISYALPYEVEFVAADEHYVSLEGDSDAIEDIEIKLDGSHLKLSNEDRAWFDWSDHDSDAVFVTIGFSQLEAIKLAGSGNGFAQIIEADDFKVSIAGSAQMEIEELEANDLIISIAGSGDAEIHALDVDEVDSAIAGSGNIKLAGQTNAQEITIAGSGDYQARELRANETDASIRGSGDIEVWSVATLKASVMGSGDIEYYGDPDVKESIMGSGNLERRGDRP